MKLRRTLLISILLVGLLSAYAGAAGHLESIEVAWNPVTIRINGQELAADTFAYQSTIYAPVQRVAEALGGKVTVNQTTGTLSIQTDQSPGAREVNYAEPVAAMEPAFSLTKLSLQANTLDAFKLEKDGRAVTAQIRVQNGMLHLTPDSYLAHNSSYRLKLFLNNGTRIVVNFKTGGLPKLTPDLTKKLIFVPAMPEKGFNYPYYMVLPSQASVKQNAGKPNYLFVETHNTGRANDDLAFHIKEALTIAEGNSASIAEAMGLPRIVPILVRPASQFEGKAIYTHALTRNAILLDRFKKGKSGYPEVFGPMDRVDLQVVAMIKHAQEALRSSGWELEDRIFMWGYSASGSFTNYFSFLHPDLVKAANFGGFPVPPVATVGATKMIYPLGTYDYKEITGRDFDLAAYNSVARLGYIGSEDRNNPTLAWDIWSPEEQRIIQKVLAVTEYPDQWNKFRAIFANSGGQAQANVYIGAGHETFYKGQGQDYLNFFRANRESESPVYVQPSDPSTSRTDIWSPNIVQVTAKPFSYEVTTIIEAFWTGMEPTRLSKSFVKWYKTTTPYTQPSDDQFLIAIAEWDSGKDYRQMTERLDKVGRQLTLRAEGQKELRVHLGGSSSDGRGTQFYHAQVLDAKDMVSGIPYQIVDTTGHWVVPEGVVVVRPER